MQPAAAGPDRSTDRATVGEQSLADLRRRLRQDGVYLRTGPFTFHITSSVPLVAQALHTVYAHFPLQPDEFADFHVRIEQPLLRRWFRPQAQFYSDMGTPFVPLPAGQAFAMLEWCMNWCIAQNSFQYLLIHAASIERGGHAAVLAAPPGSGKSTLTAALTAGAWRLLSDEFTVLRPDGSVLALGRPIALKNQSIELMQAHIRDAVIGPAAYETAKGTIAHLRPPRDSTRRLDEPALPRWVVFPKYLENSPLALEPVSKAKALVELAQNAFNYDYHGTAGFEQLADLVERCDACRLTYSSIPAAVAAFDELARQT